MYIYTYDLVLLYSSENRKILKRLTHLQCRYSLDVYQMKLSKKKKKKIFELGICMDQSVRFKWNQKSLEKNLDICFDFQGKIF